MSGISIPNLPIASLNFSVSPFVNCGFLFNACNSFKIASKMSFLLFIPPLVTVGPATEEVPCVSVASFSLALSIHFCFSPSSIIDNNLPPTVKL